VTFVLPGPPKKSWPSRQGHCKFNFVVAAGGNPTLPKVRSAARPSGVAAGLAWPRPRPRAPLCARCASRSDQPRLQCPARPFN
jgi:hypothetical protein